MSKSKNKKSKGLAGALMVLGWLLFILFAVIFYFYFWDDFPYNPQNINKAEAFGEETTTEQVKTEPYEYSYKTNENPEINQLISAYFDAYTKCDGQVLKTLVTEPQQFDDTSYLVKEAEYITGHYNINCYTLPGATEDATLVYVTSNLNINNVEVSPLDIQRFYVRKTEEGYRIDNKKLTNEEESYIDTMQQDKDIQGLYRAVSSNINQYINTDESFASFYNEVIKVN